MEKQPSQLDKNGDNTNNDYPDYLQSYNALAQYVRGQLEGLSTTEKGFRFARTAQRLIPQTEIGMEFRLPILGEKKSNDEGIDLTSTSKNGRSNLYIQSKLWIDRADMIDSILSKFQSYHTTHLQNNPQSLWDMEETTHQFLIVTLSPLQGILDKYTKQHFSSKNFFSQVSADHRLHFIDGHQILPILRATFNKITQIPTNLTLNLETPAIYKDNVFIGIISSHELKRLYETFGDALFFENVRDFLSPNNTRERTGRTTPNAEIIKTISTEPDKMLARNNGIVFGADKVELGSLANQLILHNGSVVNGCQTTMCLTEYAEESGYVLVKAVETGDAWDIAKSANYQNAVADIDLELARYLRPQLVKRAAAASSVQVDEGERSAFQIIDEIYDRKIVYEETRLLYIGIFSRTPNNVFLSNYTELMLDLINKLYINDPYGEIIFETLFTLQGAAQEGLKLAKQTFTSASYAGIFERLYGQEYQAYGCFISILALCATTNINIADRDRDETKEYNRIKDFLLKSQNILKNRKERFLRFYKHAVKIWMQEVQTDAEDAKIRQDMHSRSRRLNFTSLFRKMDMEKDLDDWFRKEEKEFLLNQGNEHLTPPIQVKAENKKKGSR